LNETHKYFSSGTYKRFAALTEELGGQKHALWFRRRGVV